MNRNFTRSEIAPGVHFNVMKDKRFKTGRISVTMFLPLSEEKASANALLPFLLGHSCEKYPDFTSLGRKLDELYGASISGNVSKIGEVQAMSLSASFLANKYALDGEDLAKELADLLCDALFRPLLEKEAFSREALEQERRQLVELIEGEFNDKKAYARKRCQELMCENEKFGISALGVKEEVQKLSGEDIYRTWQHALQHSRIEIMALGDFDVTKAQDSFRREFSKIDRGAVPGCKTEIIKKAEKVREHKEQMDIKQAKLVLGFRVGCEIESRMVSAMRVATALYGSTPTSKLFMNVREKLSLCYYCNAKYDRIKGIMLVQSGVEKKNLEKAQAEISKQLEDVAAGNFTEEDLEATKKSLANSYRTVGDFLSGLENFYLAQTFDKNYQGPEEILEEIETITKEEVAQAARLITLDTVYKLVGEEK